MSSTLNLINHLKMYAHIALNNFPVKILKRTKNSSITRLQHYYRTQCRMLHDKAGV
jgi:hypothetical protein